MAPCNICCKKIKLHKVSVACDVCSQISHPKCNGLTKSDAVFINLYQILSLGLVKTVYTTYFLT